MRLHSMRLHVIELYRIEFQRKNKKLKNNTNELVHPAFRWTVLRERQEKARALIKELPF